MSRVSRSSTLARTLLAIASLATPAAAQINMPDPSLIAGRAIPAPELPNGTVTVRLVRESIGNNITGHEVIVVAGDVRRIEKTDETGRAQFAGLPADATATAQAEVDGEKLTSQPFQVPASGGIRVILISGLEQAKARREKEAAEAAKAPPVKGAVVFGGESRLVFEFQNDRLSAFYLLDIVNTARTRVDTGGPLIINLPSGAGGARVLQGSFEGAKSLGDHITIAGPFPPGTSSVQIGFALLYSGDTLTVTQKFPATLQQLTVIAEKVGEVQLASPQFSGRREVSMQDGTPFLVGEGAALAAGSELRIDLANLPHQPTWPRNAALALAAAIIAIGAWLAFASTGERDDEHRRLIARRDSLYGEVVKLEEQRRAGRIDEERYQSKRQRLMADLEHVYGELDDRPGPGPGRGGEAAA